MDVIKHSAKGTTWEEHKYIAIKNGKYIYPKKKKSNSTENPGPSPFQIQAFFPKNRLMSKRLSTTSSNELKVRRPSRVIGKRGPLTDEEREENWAIKDRQKVIKKTRKTLNKMENTLYKNKVKTMKKTANALNKMEKIVNKNTKITENQTKKVMKQAARTIAKSNNNYKQYVTDKVKKTVSSALKKISSIFLKRG